MKKLSLILISLIIGLSCFSQSGTTVYPGTRIFTGSLQVSTTGEFVLKGNVLVSATTGDTILTFETARQSFLSLHSTAANSTLFAGKDSNYVKANWGGEYILPTASNSVLGGIKVGTGLSINGSGVLSAIGTGTLTLSDTTGGSGNGKIGTTYGLSQKQDKISGTGIPRFSGSTWSMDNNSYLTTTGTASNSSKIQNVDSFYIKRKWCPFPTKLSFSNLNNKIPFSYLNAQILPYYVTTNITITPDTTNNFSGASCVVDFVGAGGTIYFSGFDPFSGSSSIDSFIPTSNYVSTYSFVKIGQYSYMYGLQRFKYLQGSYVQLLPPSNFISVSGGTTSINLSWTQVVCRGYQIYDSIVGTSTNYSLLTSPDKTSTSYTHTGLSSNQHVYYKIRSIGNGTDTLTSSYSLTNSTTSSHVALTNLTLDAGLTYNNTTYISTSDVNSNRGYSSTAITNQSIITENTGDANCNNFPLGLSETAALQTYTSFKYGIWGSTDGNQIKYINGNGTVVSSGITWSTGTLIRVSKNNSSISIDYSTNGGNSWTNLATSTNSNNLYPVLNSSSGGKIAKVYIQ